MVDAAPAVARRRARRALEGLSVGDAFGERFFARRRAVALRVVPEPVAGESWQWTDDTAMALAIWEELVEHGEIGEDRLAQRFARGHAAEPWRGYGGSAHRILDAIGEGIPWRIAAQAPHGGQGSKGNGSAMRVAPLGAYFAHDLEVACAAARPTHAHRDGQAGAVAIAVAAALAARRRAGLAVPTGADFIGAVWELTPVSRTRDGIDLAARTPANTPVAAVAARLGNGARVLCEDTVPFCLWVVAHRGDDYEAALWDTVAVFGDMDTNCAIVGGVLAAGGAEIPASWRVWREPLPIDPLDG
jgi:ADP-ribosylglycohydrolase